MVQTKPEGDRRKESWRFSREVSIPVLAALSFQFAAGVWWVQGVAKDVTSNAYRISTLESQRIAERVVALETEMRDARSSAIRIEANLIRIEATLSRMVEKQKGAP